MQFTRPEFLSFNTEDNCSATKGLVIFGFQKFLYEGLISGKVDDFRSGGGGGIFRGRGCSSSAYYDKFGIGNGVGNIDMENGGDTNRR